MFKMLKRIRVQIWNNFLSGRIIVILMLNAVLMSQIVGNISGFSELVDVRTSPWVFPFLMQQNYIQLIFVLGAVMLFCDAPFFEGISVFEIMRSGKREWFISRILYIVFSSIIYVLLVVLLTVLMLVKRIDLTDEWGKVLTTLASTNAAEVMGNKYIGLDYHLIVMYTPLQAMLMSMGIAILVSTVVGLLIFAVNMNARYIHGGILGGLIGILPFFQRNFSNLYVISYFSPATWMDIGLWNREVRLHYPSVSYMELSFIILLIGLVLISIIGFRRKMDLCEEVKNAWRQ